MRWIVITSLMGVILLLAGGCRTKANTPGYEEQQLQTQYENLAAQLTMQVDDVRGAVNVADWLRVNDLSSQQEALFLQLIETEDQLAALGASPSTDLRSLPGLEVPPPPPTDEYDTPEGRAKVDSLWVVISLIEDAIQDAVTASDQGLVDDLLHNREPYMQNLYQLIGKPASG